MTTMAIWSNGTLWLGVLLQVTLLVMMARRRLAFVLPVFTGLLLFYALRSLLLFGLQGHMPREAYRTLYNSLALVDFILQAALASSLLVHIMPRGRRLAVGAAALLAATGTTVLAAVLLPSRSPAPADRATIFTGLLFAMLLVIAAKFCLRGWVRSIVRGLAAVGLFGALAECGKSVAAFQRNGHAYVAWSYLNALVYLAVLVFWTASVQRTSIAAEVDGSSACMRTSSHEFL